MKLNLNILALAAALSLVVVAAAVHGAGGGMPADKMAVAGSTLEINEPGVAADVLHGTMKTSSPTDAIITVSLECDILTSVTTTGDDSERAFGEIRVWVELDGAPIPVSRDDEDTTGEVVFCNRAHQQTTSGFDDPFEQDNKITSFLQTRTANSFQWITLNIGSGTHSFVVKALLTETATNDAVAKAAIGKRTLTVDPTKLAVDAEI